MLTMSVVYYKGRMLSMYRATYVFRLSLSKWLGRAHHLPNKRENLDLEGSSTLWAS
jgi:hypothetical protein